MPDQSSASTEHALIQEITAPLATLPDDPVQVTADADFPVVLRGYDRIAVDAYVRKTSQLVAELQATRSPEAAVRRALERVGEEVAGILQRAHDTAARITTHSRAEAEDRLEKARREAAQIVAAATTRVKELDAETERVWAERHRLVEDARELARQLHGLADSATDRFPAAEEPEADAEAEAGPAPGAYDQDAVGEDLEPTDEPLPGAPASTGAGGLPGAARVPGTAEPGPEGPDSRAGSRADDDDPVEPESSTALRPLDTPPEARP
ncbi:MAG: hypothetical protein JO168_01875 [Solirubrobacterales bacterium]|nr:hypothetical protein [Solirubrobacterales bacterium]MBV9716037.1 hypothetical protein [Solirubrobacterales bacterium]